MNGKIYVVIFKNKIFEFNNWDDCKKFIEDKNDVRFKSFLDKNEAKKFIDANVKKSVSLKDVPVIYPFGFLFKKDNKNVASYSYIIEYNDKILYKETKFNNKPDSNYPVELYSIIEALELLIENKYSHCIIAYNFLGVEMWANGSWTPKSKPIERYVKQINSLKEKINLDCMQVSKELILEKRQKKEK